jgi:hypothetical protein
MTGRLAAALYVLFLATPAAHAAAISPSTSIASLLSFAIPADWQDPWQLPRRFRNHCRYDYFTPRPYCSDHCGADYQFYYCSEASFGCCHLGRGYCDWRGFLRCYP